MAHTIHRVEYFYTTVNEEPKEVYELLSQLARLGVNLLALTAIPMGPLSTQLTLFPQNAPQLVNAAAKAGLVLAGPHLALLVQGDDELGALAKIHSKLHDAKVNVYASNGVTDGRGHYGYVIYLRPEEFQQAAQALEV
jgi:hypothetical protein